MQDGKGAMQNSISENEFNRYLELIGEGRDGLENWENQLNTRTDGLDDMSLVVFNSNPFTIGHRYLVEIASKRSKHVLVLVIQGRPESGGKGNHETTGIAFDFNDRLAMTERHSTGIWNSERQASGACSEPEPTA